MVPNPADLPNTTYAAPARSPPRRTRRWKRLLEEGRYRSAGEIAKAESVTRSFVNRLIRVTLLAPDIQEAILDSRQPKGMQLEELTRVMSSDWGQQRRRVGW